MIATIKVQKKITITEIKLTLPVRYGDEDIPYDFPLRHGDIWEASIDIDNGKIMMWPDNPKFKDTRLYLKVCDSGTYTLIGPEGGLWKEIASIKQDYVPHGVVPGHYGDYVDLDILDGQVTNWPLCPDVSAFFPEIQNQTHCHE